MVYGYGSSYGYPYGGWGYNNYSTPYSGYGGWGSNWYNGNQNWGNYGNWGNWNRWNAPSQWNWGNRWSSPSYFGGYGNYGYGSGYGHGYYGMGSSRLGESNLRGSMRRLAYDNEVDWILRRY